MKMVALITGVFIMVGIIMMARGIRDVLRARQSVEWRPVPATIVVSRAVYGSEGTSKPEVSFSYSVADIGYKANTVYFGQGISVGGGGLLARILERYPIGARVTAYYSPEDPSLAVLEPGFRKTSLTFIAFGWLFFAMGSGFLFLWWTTTP